MSTIDIKKFDVMFRTDTNYNVQFETVEADNKGEAIEKVRQLHGKIVVYNIYKRR